MLSHLANHERLLFLLQELLIVGLFQPLIVSNSKITTCFDPDMQFMRVQNRNKLVCPQN